MNYLSKLSSMSLPIDELVVTSSVLIVFVPTSCWSEWVLRLLECVGPRFFDQSNLSNSAISLFIG